MSNEVEVRPLSPRVIPSPDHFEQPFLRGEEAKYNEYAAYVADHHIVELMMGPVNWRDYGLRATRIGRQIDPSVFLLLEDNLQLGVAHEWGTLNAGGGGSAAGRFISTIARGAAEAAGAVTGTHSGDLMLSPLRVLEAKYFKGSDAWSFPLKFTFRMGQYGLWDAEKEVWEPLIALLIMCTMVNRGDTFGGWPQYETPGPTQFGLIGSMASELLSGAWDTARDLVGSDQDPFDALNRFFSSGTSDAGATLSNASKAVTLIFGLNFPETQDEDGGAAGIGQQKQPPKEMNYRNIMYFDPCYIENVRASFGREKDMKGFPIEGTIDLSIKTVLPALGNDITGINSTWHPSGNAPRTDRTEAVSEEGRAEEARNTGVVE